MGWGGSVLPVLALDRHAAKRRLAMTNLYCAFTLNGTVPLVMSPSGSERTTYLSW